MAHPCSPSNWSRGLVGQSGGLVPGRPHLVASRQVALPGPGSCTERSGSWVIFRLKPVVVQGNRAGREGVQ
jgi:hypothetical protein